jgi:hypothetical protein
VIAIKVLPGVAICAIDSELTRSRLIILFDDVFDHADDAMGTATASPTQIANSIVAAGVPRVTLTLHCVPSNGANRGVAITCSHVHRICCMAEVPSAGMRPCLMRANAIARRRGKSKTCGGHGFTWCFERDDRKTVSQGDKTAR